MVGWKRAIGAAALSAMLAFGVAACGSDDDGESASAGTGAATTAASGDAGKKVRLAAFILASANSYSQSNLRGVEEAAKAAGNVTVRAFDGRFDGAAQLNQIQDAVASGQYDAFVIFPNDGAAIVPGVEEAADEGIKVVAAYAPIGTDIDTGEPQVDGVLATVWHPNRPNGVELGNLTVEACEAEHADADPCRVAYISGGNAISFEQAKLEDFKRTIEAADQSIELVAQQEGGFLVDPSRTATENILQANKELDVIVTSGDQMTLGAEQAVDDAGREGITLIGNGAAAEGVERIKARKWFGSPVFLAIDEGRQAAQIAIDAVRGRDPAQSEVDVVAESPIGPSFTQRTTDPFEPQWAIGG